MEKHTKKYLPVVSLFRDNRCVPFRQFYACVNPQTMRGFTAASFFKLNQHFPRSLYFLLQLHRTDVS